MADEKTEILETATSTEGRDTAMSLFRQHQMPSFEHFQQHGRVPAGHDTARMQTDIRECFENSESVRLTRDLCIRAFQALVDHLQGDVDLSRKSKKRDQRVDANEDVFSAPFFVRWEVPRHYVAPPNGTSQAASKREAKSERAASVAEGAASHPALPKMRNSTRQSEIIKKQVLGIQMHCIKYCQAYNGLLLV
jgi:hypothetical protein